MIKNPKFSIILATIERTRELENFLESLKSQTYNNFELIVIDQNTDNRLQPIIDMYSPYIPILLLHSAPGLSKSRNLGIRHSQGDLLCFPDDDCVYPSMLLEHISTFSCNYNNYSGFIIVPRDFDGNPLTNPPSFNKIMKMTKWSILRSVNSISFFIKKEVFDKIYFDENLGAGSKTYWPAGEDNDLAIRALINGYSFLLLPNLSVFHPKKNNTRDLIRAKVFARSFGMIYKKNKLHINFLYSIFRSIIGSALYLLTGKMQTAKYHWITLIWRCKGWTDISSRSHGLRPKRSLER